MVAAAIAAAYAGATPADAAGRFAMLPLFADTPRRMPFELAATLFDHRQIAATPRRPLIITVTPDHRIIIDAHRHRLRLLINTFLPRLRHRHHYRHHHRLSIDIV